MSESSAVSGLIRLQRTRRIQTQPGDEYLFQPRSGERPRPRAQLFAMPAPAIPVERASAPPIRARPRAPARRRTGVWVAVMLLAAAAGLVVAAYYPFTSSAPDDAPAFVIPQIAVPAPAPAPVVAPAPIAAEPAPAAAPIADTPAAAAPIADTPAAAPAATPAAPHHRRHVVKPKKLVAKHATATAKTATAKAPAPSLAAEPAAAPASHPSRPAHQADDDENPL
ncbi:MAG TPA: hypothetical protein VMJ10_37890 [Kofleriaceae bacterium]|nr:hypothetical protein [Kofleriaceae bacterium]